MVVGFSFAYSPGYSFDSEFLSFSSLVYSLDEFLNLLREYKNICGKVRSIKFSIKSKQFYQSIESPCNDFRNKNARSAWLKLKKLSHPMYSILFRQAF